MIIYLATTLDLMVSKGLEKEAEEIANNSEAFKLNEIIYFKLKEDSDGD